MSAICTADKITAGLSRWRRAATTAPSPTAEVTALTNMAASRGRRLIQSSSPSIARVDQARSFPGLPKTKGFSASHNPISAAWLHRRVHTGTRVSGVLAQRVHALRGWQCLANIARRTRATQNTSYRVAVLECSVWTGGPAGAAGGDVPGNGIRGTPKVLS